MSDDTTYQGWTNYPTWAVNLWLNNERPLYEDLRDRALHARTIEDEGERAVTYLLADDIKEWVTDDLAPDLGASFAADLLGWALGAVDWAEIAAVTLAGLE